MDVSGKRVLLTGATGGLGRATAIELAGRGATILLSARKREALEALAAELAPAAGGAHEVLPAELGEEGAAEALCEQAGEVDVLVANAALPGTGRLDSYSAEEVARVLRVNLEAPILMARVLLPQMRERDSGQIVFVASLSGKAATPRSSLYCASKFGMRGFAHSLRADAAGTGVGVSLVSPGFISEAGMFAASGTKLPPGLGTRRPEHVARAVAKAIERNRAEVIVSSLPVRISAALAGAAPVITSRISSSRSGSKIARDVARGQADRR